MFELRSALMVNFSTPPGPLLEDRSPMEIEEPLELDPGRGEHYVFDITEGAVLQVAVNTDASVEISLSDGSEVFETPSIGRKFFAVTSARATCQFGAPYTGTLLLSLLNTDRIPVTGSVMLKTEASASRSL